METVKIGRFAKIFAEEINKSATVQKYVGEVSEKDIWLIHKPATFRIFDFLYSNNPAVLFFGKFFYLFTKPQDIIDKYSIEKSHERFKEANKKRGRAKADRNKYDKKLWSAHLGTNI